MCITCFSSRNKPNKETLRICFANNKDGAGFAYAQEGKLVMEKGFFTFEHFWSEYKKVPENVPFVLHFRKVSVGPKDKKNCHPWQIDENHVFAHNGTIKQFDDKNDKLSDTGRFVNEILKPMFASDTKLWQTEWAKDLLENYIGKENKCIVLSNTGDYLLLNEDRGIWDNGVWYSNDSFRRRGLVSWSDYSATEKKNISLSGITLEYAPVSLATVDTILDKLNKRVLSKFPLNLDNFKTKKVYNVQLTPYAERLIAEKSIKLKTETSNIKSPSLLATNTSTGFKVNEKPMFDHPVAAYMNEHN